MQPHGTLAKYRSISVHHQPQTVDIKLGPVPRDRRQEVTFSNTKHVPRRGTEGGPWEPLRKMRVRNNRCESIDS